MKTEKFCRCKTFLFILSLVALNVIITLFETYLWIKTHLTENVVDIISHLFLILL
jgi:hypothetical protein